MTSTTEDILGMGIFANILDKIKKLKTKLTNEEEADRIRQKFDDYGQTAESEMEHFIPIGKYSGFADYKYYNSQDGDIYRW